MGMPSFAEREGSPAGRAWRTYERWQTVTARPVRGNGWFGSDTYDPSHSPPHLSFVPATPGRKTRAFALSDPLQYDQFRTVFAAEFLGPRLTEAERQRVPLYLKNPEDRAASE